MTAAVDAGAQPRTRGWTLRILLALSVTLNVFFVAGLLWSMFAAEPIGPPAMRFVAIGHRLDLSPQQRAALDAFGATAHRHAGDLRTANGPLMRQIWDEMAKPDPDQPAIDKLAEQMNQNRLAYQKQMSASLAAFLKTLSPEQRARFVDLAAQRPDGRHALRLPIP